VSLDAAVMQVLEPLLRENLAVRVSDVADWTLDDFRAIGFVPLVPIKRILRALMTWRGDAALPVETDATAVALNDDVNDVNDVETTNDNAQQSDSSESSSSGDSSSSDADHDDSSSSDSSGADDDEDESAPVADLDPKFDAEAALRGRSTAIEFLHPSLCVGGVATTPLHVGSLKTVSVVVDEPDSSAVPPSNGAADDDSVSLSDEDDAPPPGALNPNSKLGPGYIGTVNEVVELAAPPVHTKVLADDEPVTPFGSVMQVMSDRIVVQSLPNARVLDEESLLCLASRRVLGAVFEVFGPVVRPMYVVLFSSADELAAYVGETSVKVGDAVSSADRNAKFVEMQSAMQRGCDASNVFDEEVDPAHGDFSDDEEEARAKREDRLERQKRARIDANGNSVVTAAAKPTQPRARASVVPVVSVPMPVLPSEQQQQQQAAYLAQYMQWAQQQQPTLWQQQQHQQQSMLQMQQYHLQQQMFQMAQQQQQQQRDQQKPI
jgi:rRNA processing protein Gar1